MSNCDKIFTKHIKYQSPVLYELEKLKKEVDDIDISGLETEIAKKQDKLTPGQNISIVNNVISATGGEGTIVEDTNGNQLQTARFSGHNGINVDMDENDPSDFNIRLDQDIIDEIESKQDQLSVGIGISIDASNEISVKLGQGLFIDENSAIRLNNDTLNKLESIETKQDKLTFDDVPTQNSNNPVKSGGVYNALNTNYERLYDGSAVASGIVNLNNSIDNYKELLFVAYYSTGVTNYYSAMTVSVEFFKLMTSPNNLLVAMGGDWCSLTYNNATQLTVTGTSTNARFFSVYGKK